MNPWQTLIEPPSIAPARSCAFLGERCTCAVKLLRHGPLCWKDFVEITGWHTSLAASVLRDLMRAGLVYRALGEWRLAA